MKYLIIAILISLISCQTKEQMMSDFVKCAKNQVGKPYLESFMPEVLMNFQMQD